MSQTIWNSNGLYTAYLES